MNRKYRTERNSRIILVHNSQFEKIKALSHEEQTDVFVRKLFDRREGGIDINNF